MYVLLISFRYTMTLIVIIIDGKVHCSFDGDLRRWRHEMFFKVPNPKPQTSITESTGPAPPVRTKKLRIFGNVHTELDMTLALFCYDMENPTKRRIGDDMHQFVVDQYRKTKG